LVLLSAAVVGVISSKYVYDSGSLQNGQPGFQASGGGALLMLEIVVQNASIQGDQRTNTRSAYTRRRLQ
jgi:hypothetical protein